MALFDLNKKKPNLVSAYRSRICYSRKVYFNLYRTLVNSFIKSDPYIILFLSF